MKTNTNFEQVLTEAHEAAARAVEDMGPENPMAFDCGFSWITIDGNEPLARYCRGKVKEVQKEQKVAFYGSKDIATHRRYGTKGHPSGWQWWNPGGFAGQAIGIKEAGSRAFRDVMARHGIRVDCGSRYD